MGQGPIQWTGVPSLRPLSTFRGTSFAFRRIRTSPSRPRNKTDPSSPTRNRYVWNTENGSGGDAFTPSTWVPTTASAGGTTMPTCVSSSPARSIPWLRSEEHTSELQSREKLVCRLLLEKKKKEQYYMCFSNRIKVHIEVM